MLAMYMRLAAMRDQDVWRMQDTSFKLLHSGGTTLVGPHLHTAVSLGRCDNPQTRDATGFTQPRLQSIR